MPWYVSEKPAFSEAQLVIVAIDARCQDFRGRRSLLSEENCGEEGGGQKKQGAAPYLTGPGHCRFWVQLVPPAGSYLMEPNWSLQKPRSPVLPTVCGTAVMV